MTDLQRGTTRAGGAATAAITLHGWGGGRRSTATVIRPQDIAALRVAVNQTRDVPAGAIARGLGRSYGDAAQLHDGLVLDTTALDSFTSADGEVTAQAGVTIGALLRDLVPAGWMVPVVPGTQHVTVGGAIASDIHGKNHGHAGTFGSHVRALGLLAADGELYELGPGDRLFQATLGGMGLTGVIAWARLALRSVAGPLLAVDTDRVQDIDQALAALNAPGGPHRVAWLDLLGSHTGRGIVTRADHIVGAAGSATVRARATIPRRWPGGLLRPATVRAFNAWRFRRAPSRERGRPEGIGTHMFPLDAVSAWPRLYGAAGLVQYQLAVPLGAEHVLTSVVEHLRRARVPCYLAVLKDFGPANDAPLSFPLEGWTLALDIPRAADGLDRALDRCDDLVATAGGRVYLSKDARLRPAMVRAMYPRLEEWQAVRDRADPQRRWRSDLAVRTGLIR